MTSNKISQLYPAPARVALEGLYLAHDLRAVAAGQPFVYANFVASLDGRIAIVDPVQGGMKAPAQVVNDRDWRLFQELAIQADLIITTGRYLRDYAAGKAQEILRVYDDPRFADLQAWRDAQGLSLQPDLAVVSSSLDFPVPEVLTHNSRRVVVVTDRRADPGRVRELESQVGPVFFAGEERVQGDRFVEQMRGEGYRLIYSAAGPKIAHMLLAGGVLDRLYLTQVSRLLGGAPFSSIVEGPLLEPPVDLPLHHLYYDAAGVEGVGQLFGCYARR
ncbi:MAG: dihydrofolate reductase family protein [Caldilineaceae bacterium]|jgi:riboflavin biosynthesis pyrimidine reductase|nr:dihydrofolate reductase family protein [Caldilineaceae bacterium]